MTDNGAAALADALARWCGDAHPDGDDHEQALAILGERGVFLPDGLDGLIAKVEALPVLHHNVPDYAWWPDAPPPPDVWLNRAAVLDVLRGER